MPALGSARSSRRVIPTGPVGRWTKGAIPDCATDGADAIGALCCVRNICTSARTSLPERGRPTPHCAKTIGSTKSLSLVFCSASLGISGLARHGYSESENHRHRTIGMLYHFN